MVKLKRKPKKRMAAQRKKTARVKARKPANRRKILVKAQKASVKKSVQNKIKHVKRASVKKPPKRKLELKPVLEAPVESLFKAKIKVIGIGGGGGSIVSEIGRSLEKATFVIADTDIRALKKRPGIKYFWFGENLTHGLGTGVNVELAKQAAEGAKEKISSFFKDQDIVIFIASLGGGLGSGATQIFAEAAREFGGITFGIFTMPFKFEGKNKSRIAQNALKSLRQSLNVSLTIPNERIFKIIDSSTPIVEAFSVVNKSLIESLESLIDLIYNPGIINIDFADLRAILKGRGNLAFLNTVEESGKNRADKICEKVLSNPLLYSSNLEAEKILFNIAGSENLSMFEVEKVSRHIADLNPKAKIIFGISKNSKLKNKIKTTILMTGGEIEEKVQIQKTPALQALTQEPEKEKIIENVKIKEPEKDPLPKKVKSKSEIKKKTEKKPLKKQKKESLKKPKKEKRAPAKPEPEPEPASYVPVFRPALPVSIVETSSIPVKKTIRRSGLEIKKAEELEEKKRLDQEKEWEIPAFLRRVKFNK